MKKIKILLALTALCSLFTANASGYFEVKCKSGYKLKKSGQAKFKCVKTVRKSEEYRLSSNTKHCANGLSKDKHWKVIKDNSGKYDQCVKHKKGSRKSGKVSAVKCKSGFDIVPQKGFDKCVKPGKTKTSKPKLDKA